METIKPLQKYYLQATKRNPLDVLAYRRLMMYYRKQKDYDKESQLIQTAIDAHTNVVYQSYRQWLLKNRRHATTAKALIKSLGLLDRKGMPVVDDPQVDAWKKRLAIVKKRIKTKSTAQKRR